MDGFDAVAGRERRQIAEEMGETIAQERADRLVERGLRRQRGGSRPDRRGRLRRQEAARALGLALDAEPDRHRLDHLKTVGEQRRGRAGLELELDFAEQLASLAGEEEAGIQRDLDRRAADIHRPRRPADVGAELRLESLAADDLGEVARSRGVEQGQIRLGRGRLHFLFVPFEHAPIGICGPFEAENAGAVLPPDAQRGA